MSGGGCGGGSGGGCGCGSVGRVVVLFVEVVIAVVGLRCWLFTAVRLVSWLAEVADGVADGWMGEQEGGII